MPAEQPRAIYIDKLGVAARIQAMGTNPDKSLQAPLNIYDTGWYSKSAKPGHDGAVLIDGHSGLDIPGIFDRLEDLSEGDRITVETGNGTKYSYVVAARDRRPIEGRHGQGNDAAPRRPGTEPDLVLWRMGREDEDQQQAGDRLRRAGGHVVAVGHAHSLRLGDVVRLALDRPDSQTN